MNFAHVGQQMHNPNMIRSRSNGQESGILNNNYSMLPARLMKPHELKSTIMSNGKPYPELASTRHLPDKDYSMPSLQKVRKGEALRFSSDQILMKKRDFNQPKKILQSLQAADLPKVKAKEEMPRSNSRQSAFSKQQQDR